MRPLFLTARLEAGSKIGRLNRDGPYSLSPALRVAPRVEVVLVALRACSVYLLQTTRLLLAVLPVRPSKVQYICN